MYLSLGILNAGIAIDCIKNGESKWAITSAVVSGLLFTLAIAVGVQI